MNQEDLDRLRAELAEREFEVEVIERNSVICDLCGDEIESTHRHDWKFCKCGRVSVDGGHDYRKVSWRDDGGPTYTDTSIYHTEIRRWGETL
jgi:hypothetical protein